MNRITTFKKIAGALSVRFLVVASILLVALLVFGLIADEMVLEHENKFDFFVFEKIKHLINPAMTRLMLGITFFGSSRFLFPAYILLVGYFLFFEKNKTVSFNVGAIGITSYILLRIVKWTFQRSRPLHPLVDPEMGYSFPSGHSFSSFTFFALLIYAFWNHKMHPALRWSATIFFFLFASTIAFSRVYLQVHFASDVIAGFCLCIIWMVASLWVIKKLEKEKVVQQ